jgi:RNA-splicing ligase RtcB
MIIIPGKHTTAKVMIDKIDSKTMEQIQTMVNAESFSDPVIMPDTHAGAGSVIGFTMNMTDKIIPNIVGVDIGCGMLSVNIVVSPYRAMLKEELDTAIRKAIPFGTNVREKGIANIFDRYFFEKCTEKAHVFTLKFNSKFGKLYDPPVYSIEWLEKKAHSIGIGMDRVINSIGTLGGGNHFIEIGRSDVSGYWITIHSGSRNFGLKIANYWQRIAKKTCGKDKMKLKIKEIVENTSDKTKISENIEHFKKNNLPVPSGLEYLEGENLFGYLTDMIFATEYAKLNRSIIANEILELLDLYEMDEIETVHNYIDFNDFIIRKGAIASYIAERMIIPFNMRDGILICEGKSNPEWNYSAPHGAGRVLSRRKAKEILDMNNFKNEMSGIFSTSVTKSTLDESPMAYKDSSIIEKAIEPTATIIDRINPIHNLKDN